MNRDDSYGGISLDFPRLPGGESGHIFLRRHAAIPAVQNVPATATSSLGFRWEEGSAHRPPRACSRRAVQRPAQSGIEVDATDNLQAARSLWRPRAYDLILLDARGHLPGEALDFYHEIKHASPRDRIVFLVGPPMYVSLTWPAELMAAEKEPQQWAETVRQFVPAA